MKTETRTANADNANVVGNVIYQMLRPLLDEYEVQDVVLGLSCALVAVARMHGVTTGSLKEVLSRCLKADFIKMEKGGLVS